MRVFTLPSGEQIGAEDQFQIGDQRFPAGWLVAASDEEIAAKGIVATVVADPPPAPPPPPVVPGSASKLGLKRAFVELGTWAAVKAAIAANADAQEDWDLAVVIRRADPLVQGMIAALGLTSQQVDALLIRSNELG